MFRNTAVKIILGIVAAIAVLALLRFKPWQRALSPQTTETFEARQRLGVGFLPVT